MFEKVAILVALPVLVPHELCHYLAARALGVQVRFHLTHIVLLNVRHDWRVHVVTLAPALMGMVVSVLIFATLMYFEFPMRLVVLFFPLAILWQGTCWNDYADWYRAAMKNEW